MNKNKTHQNLIGENAHATPLLRNTSVATGVALLATLAATQASTDYAPAIWNPPCNANYNTSGYGHKFHVVHDIEGYYLGCISMFKGCGYTSASIHYVVNGKKDTTSDAPAGEITQMVRDVNYAWHARCWNSHATGTEHEGFASNPAWYTDALYQASAGLTRNLSAKFGWAKDRNHVIAHGQKSVAGWPAYASANLGIDPNCNTHTDPGPYWDWSKYMSLVNNSGGTVPSITMSRKGDFNGDGKSDVITFNRGTLGDAWVALSTGSGFGASAKWHDAFCYAEDLPSVGDVNGDGKDDIILFNRGSLGDVWVALSTGTSFGPAAKWKDWFCHDSQIPVVGDFNGDGKDDVAVFERNATSGGVWVALSTGTSFGAEGLWHNLFCHGSQIPAVGDFNGDGKDDIISFDRGTTADVWVSLSTGSGFGGAGIWHQAFCNTDQIPVIGDFNGDGKDDVAAFTRGTTADIWITLSSGSGFLPESKWHDAFCNGVQLPGSGDFNGDGKDDVAVFTRVTDGKVWVSLSTGGGLTGGSIWGTGFCFGGEIPMPSSNIW